MGGVNSVAPGVLSVLRGRGPIKCASKEGFTLFRELVLGIDKNLMFGAAHHHVPKTRHSSPGPGLVDEMRELAPTNYWTRT
jgi:hypothetical protein